MAMQEQIKSLEEKNAKLTENNIKMFSDNKRISSEVRRLKHQMEQVRANDNRKQLHEASLKLQLQEYSKLLNETKAKNIELENIIKAGVDGETISPQVKAKIGYDLLCTKTHSGDANSEPNSGDLNAICEILTGSDIGSRLSSRCPSCILDDYLSDIESNCEDNA